MDCVKRSGFRLARDTTVAAWLDEAGQTGALRRHLWEPLCLAALNTPADRASAQLFANVLRDSLGSPRRADTDLLLPRVPLGELLPEPAGCWLAANGATIRLSHRVRALTLQTDQVQVDDLPFDAAVLAIAPQHAAALWPDASVPNGFEPIATVYLQYPPSYRLPFPLYSLSGPLGQWVVDRGNGLLACVLSGHGDWERHDDAALAQALHSELRIQAPPLRIAVVREKRATFAAVPKLRRPKPQPGRLQLAGDYAWSDYPATLEGAVRSGVRAAQVPFSAPDFLGNWRSSLNLYSRYSAHSSAPLAILHCCPPALTRCTLPLQRIPRQQPKCSFHPLCRHTN